MINIPGLIGWKQPNEGDRQGTIWLSRNLDLTSKRGSLMISPRLLLNVNTADLANLTGSPCAFKFWQSTTPDVWTIAGARLFRSNGEGPQNTFIQDDKGGSPTSLNTSQSDLELFNGAMYASGADTALYKISTTTWSSVAAAINNSSGLHQMNYFRAQNRLYFVDDNARSIGSINTSDVAATMGNQYTLQNLVGGGNYEIISWIKSTSSRIWIGTRNLTGATSKIYSWDGSQQSGPNETYTVDAAGTLAGVVKDGTIYVFDTEGRLLKW